MIRHAIRSPLRTAAYAACGRGGDLLSNGGMGSDTVWAKGAGWTIAGGKASVAAGGTATNLVQTLSLKPGVGYLITWTVLDFVAGGSIPRINGDDIITGPQQTANGTYTEYLVAGAGPSALHMRSSSTGQFSIDNVSMREATW